MSDKSKMSDQPLEDAHKKPQGGQSGLHAVSSAGRVERRQAEVAVRQAALEPLLPDIAAAMLLRMPKVAPEVLAKMDHKTAAAMIGEIAKSVEPEAIASRWFKSMEPKAIAGIIENMQDPKVATAIFKEIAPKKAAEVVLEGDLKQAIPLFQNMELKEVANIFKEMVSKDSGKTARLLEAIEPGVATQVVNVIDIKYVVIIFKEMDPKLAADLLLRTSIDRVKDVSIAKARDIIVAMDPKAAASLVGEMAEQSPNRTARRMEKVPIDRVVSIFEAMPVDEAGKVLTKMRPEQATRIMGKMNSFTSEAVGLTTGKPVDRVLPKIMQPATEVISNTASPEGVSDASRPLVPGSDRSVSMAAIRITMGNAEDAADVLTRTAESKGLKTAAFLFENVPAKTAAGIVEQVENPKLVASIFQKMDRTDVIKVALEADLKAIVPVFGKMPAKEVVSILGEMAKENKGLTARVLETIHVKIASRVVRGMETAEAATMLSEMSAKPVAGIMERVSAYEAVRIVKTLGVENEVVRNALQEMSSKRATDVVASLNMLGDPSADQGKFSEMVERALFTVKYTQYQVFSDIPHKLHVGSAIFFSSTVSAFIDQFQIFEQQHFRLNAYVIDSYMGSLSGSLIAGNLFYRLTQTWVTPKWVPIVGGKTIGQFPTVYQISYSAVWGLVGTGIQLVVQPWLSSKGILPPIS